MKHRDEISSHILGENAMDYSIIVIGKRKDLEHMSVKQFVIKLLYFESNSKFNLISSV